MPLRDQTATVAAWFCSLYRRGGSLLSMSDVKSYTKPYCYNRLLCHNCFPTVFDMASGRWEVKHDGFVHTVYGARL